MRAHISEIVGSVAAHTSSQALPVFGTSTKKFKTCQKFYKISETVRTLPNASERIRTCPNASRKVRTGPNTSPNLRKTKTSRKFCELRVRAVVVLRLAQGPHTFSFSSEQPGSGALYHESKFVVGSSASPSFVEFEV